MLLGLHLYIFAAISKRVQVRWTQGPQSIFIPLLAAIIFWPDHILLYFCRGKLFVNRVMTVDDISFEIGS